VTSDGVLLGMVIVGLLLLYYLPDLLGHGADDE